MPIRHTPIDGAAEYLLENLMQVAAGLRESIEAGRDDYERMRGDYEALRRLAAKLTVEGESPVPPLPDRSN